MDNTGKPARGGGILKAIKDIIYGMSSHEMTRHAVRSRASMEHLFILITMGDLLGVPILPPYYSLRLLPYVTRLACADTPKVEKARAAYIQRHMGRYFVGILLFGMAAFSFDRGLKALEGALAIGRQADPLGPEEVQARMDAARTGQFKPTRAATPASVTHKPFFSKIKSWLTTKETEPAA